MEGAPFTARQVADCQQAEGQLFVYSGLSDLPPEVLRTQRVDLVSNMLRDVQTLKRLRTPTVALAAWQAFVTLLRATGPKLGNRMSDAAFEKALLALAQADRGWRPRCYDVDLWGTQHGVGAGGRPSGSG